MNDFNKTEIYQWQNLPGADNLSLNNRIKHLFIYVKKKKMLASRWRATVIEGNKLAFTSHWEFTWKKPNLALSSYVVKQRGLWIYLFIVQTQHYCPEIQNMEFSLSGWNRTLSSLTPSRIWRPLCTSRTQRAHWRSSLYRSLYSAPKEILHTYVFFLMMNFQAPLTMSIHILFASLSFPKFDDEASDKEAHCEIKSSLSTQT